MSNGRITKKHAEDIAKKLNRAMKDGINLEAITRQGGKHDIVEIKYNNILIATYMIRHSKKVSHDLTAQSMFLSISDAIQYSTCHISNAKYLEILKEKGKLPILN